MRQAGQGQGPADFYWQLPPVTRAHATAVTAVWLAQFAQLLPGHWFALFWRPVLRQAQVWRLLSNFLLTGMGWGFLVRLLWIIQYGAKLEQQTFGGNTADYLYMLLVCSGHLVAQTALVPRPALGSSLIFALIYVWARNFGSSRVSLFGLVSLQSAYFPFALAGLDFVTGGDWVGDLMGLAAGHMYWFFRDVHPSAGGRRYLETPLLLKRWLVRRGWGSVPAAQVPLANPSNPGFSSFRGPARRLDE